MEEFYPGKGSGDGYYVEGTADVVPSMRSKPLAATPMVVIGISSYGRKNMSVYQEGLPHTPIFDLRPLTRNSS